MREKILYALQEEANLTVQQLARLLKAPENSVYKTLKRLKKLVVQRPLPFGTSHSWKLAGDKRKSLSEQNYKHEQDCSDVYVALRGLGVPLVWVQTSDQKDSLRFDRYFEIYGKSFYLEVERGSQKLEDVRNKIQAYETLPGRFHVIITVQDYQPNPFEPVIRTAQDHGGEILNILREYRRANKYLVAKHKDLITNPASDCLFSPQDTVSGFLSVS